MLRAVMVSLGGAGVVGLGAVLVLGWGTLARAQTAQLQLVPSNSVPKTGTFWSIQLTNYPPLPFSPFPELDVYSWSDTPGRYCYDDRAVDYVALREQRELERALRRLEGQYGLSSPEGVDADNGLPGGPGATYAEGSLWLSIAPLTNGAAPLTIHGTTPEWLYEIQSRLTLTNTGWASEGGVLGAANQDRTPMAVEVGERTNSLFLRAVAWGECDGYGTPWAWYVQHGLYPLADGIGTQDPDHDGLLNWQEYRYGSDPVNSEVFSVWVSSPAGYSGIP